MVWLPKQGNCRRLLQDIPGSPVAGFYFSSFPFSNSIPWQISGGDSTSIVLSSVDSDKTQTELNKFPGRIVLKDVIMRSLFLGGPLMNGITDTLYFCILLILLIGLACGGTAPSPTPSPLVPTVESLIPGDTTHSLNFGGEERSYILHIPHGLDGTHATPVVLIFHGFGLNAEEMIRITGFNTQADDSGFFAVYPNGSGRKPSWNGGDCCGEAATKKVDDVGFVRALIKDLSNRVNIDPNRIFATGSNR